MDLASGYNLRHKLFWNKKRNNLVLFETLNVTQLSTLWYLQTIDGVHAWPHPN